MKKFTITTSTSSSFEEQFHLYLREVCQEMEKTPFWWYLTGLECYSHKWQYIAKEIRYYYDVQETWALQGVIEKIVAFAAADALYYYNGEVTFVTEKLPELSEYGRIWEQAIALEEEEA